MLREWLKRMGTWWRPKASPPAPAAPIASPPPVTAPIGPLERVILTEGVERTLFEDYQQHRRTPRGQEEIGWVLLGTRQGNEALALAALPAGTQREAGIAHVQFNPDAQELASRILRQRDKRLTIIGVVHTHPGNLRQPSDGDYQGDAQWVGQLRGDGVFGIGTGDAQAKESNTPKNHQQILGDICFSWYALGRHDAGYRLLSVQVTGGPDLARPLHAVWELLEAHARPLNRLCRQLARVQFEVAVEESEKILVVKISLPPPNQQLRLLLSETEARYYWDRQDEVMAVDPGEQQLDRAVYLILAELAKDSPVNARESASVVES